METSQIKKKLRFNYIENGDYLSIGTCYIANSTWNFKCTIIQDESDNVVGSIQILTTTRLFRYLVNDQTHEDHVMLYENPISPALDMALDNNDILTDANGNSRLTDKKLSIGALQSEPEQVGL